MEMVRVMVELSPPVAYRRLLHKEKTYSDYGSRYEHSFNIFFDKVNYP